MFISPFSSSLVSVINWFEQKKGQFCGLLHMVGQLTCGGFSCTEGKSCPINQVTLD
jgi:hypothetical protein